MHKMTMYFLTLASKSLSTFFWPSCKG